MPARGGGGGFGAYIGIARLGYWFKNIFMLPGMVGAFAMQPETRSWTSIGAALISLFATCLVASSNYVLNEILDAQRDRFHPQKRERPVASGRVSVPLAYLEWGLLAAVGFALGNRISLPFLGCLVALWGMGILYNVPPIRTKEVPYLDVLSEAVNNPLRLLLGWYGVRATVAPPSSFLLAYWVIGAYLMTAKRFAEYRTIGNPETASQYRSSFAYYTEDRLATAMLAYASGFMFLVGVILVKYHVEFIIACPLLMLYLAYYSSLAYRKDSLAQTPERLYQDKPLMLLTFLVAVSLCLLAFIRIPALNDWLGITGRGW